MSSDDSGRVAPGDFPELADGPVSEVRLGDAQQTRALGRWLASELTAGDFIGLVGVLGAGKTTFVQGLVDHLDPTGRQRATSPTYALIQRYETSPPIVHIDLYRLQGWAGLESIGYWDHLDGGREIICVEWLDRIPGAWPGEGVVVELLLEGDRRIARLYADGASSEIVEDLDASTLKSFEGQENS